MNSDVHDYAIVRSVFLLVFFIRHVDLKNQSKCYVVNDVSNLVQYFLNVLIGKYTELEIMLTASNFYIEQVKMP
jgi:hypothetical protein